MQKKLTLIFKATWVVNKRENGILVVQDLIIHLRKSFNIEVAFSSIIKCDIIIKDTVVTNDEILSVVFNFLKDKFSITFEDNMFEYSLTDYMPKSEAEEDTITEPPTEIEIDINELKAKRISAVIDKINGLIGAEEFKQMANEFVSVANGLISHNALEVITHQCFLFAINDGNGYSTYLGLLAELLEALGLFNLNSKSNPIIEHKINPPQNRDRANEPFSSVFSHYPRLGVKEGRILSIDISEWMTKLRDKSFRDFLTDLEDRLGQYIIVFRVPFVEKEILEGIKRGIGDVLFVRDISFVPFTNDELCSHAEVSLKKRGFSIENEAMDVFNTRITEERNDGKFYGINTVNKVVREMIYLKLLSNSLNKIDDTVIKKSEISKLATAYDEQKLSGFEMLDGYIGMESIKEKVEEIVAQIEMSVKNSGLGQPCIHMRFVGNPGTGKTTVARVIGKILKEKGILRNGNFYEYSGRDFCGRYIGETAPKTAAMCRDAYGSVLFIDEAYSLYRSEGYSKADFGREAIDTLIAEMENHRHDLVVIMAGYPDEMESLMSANAGLESRMPYIVEFPNYTKEQLYDIFMLMVKKNFEYQEGFEEAVREYFNSLSSDVTESKEFSNARFVRNLFERTWGKAAMRAQIGKAESLVLSKEDFALASSEKEFIKIMQKKNNVLGFA